MQKVIQLKTICKPFLLILLPVSLYLIPVEGIFSGESLCLIKRCFGIECWGCGITRAVFSLLYGRFEQAWEYNAFIILVFPLLLWVWAVELRKSIINLWVLLNDNK